MKKLLYLFLPAVMLFAACDKDNPEPTDKVLRVKFKFDPNQERLDNTGNPSTVPAGNAAQTPVFHGLSGHFIEFVKNNITPYKSGEEIYMGAEVESTNANTFGFTTAVDFDQAIIKGDGETFLEIPLADIDAGTYKHFRISVTYQNYDVNFNLKNVPVAGDIDNQTGRVASFLGFNQYLSDVTVRDQDLAVNGARLQGFWAFQTDLPSPFEAYNQIVFGQAPLGETTVVNPFPANPVPPGSCVVVGSFDQDLKITGTEAEDVELTLSFSIDNSFEWEDVNGNGEWDIDAGTPTNSEPIVDMGLRGVKGLVGQ